MERGKDHKEQRMSRRQEAGGGSRRQENVGRRRRQEGDGGLDSFPSWSTPAWEEGEGGGSVCEYCGSANTSMVCHTDQLVDWGQVRGRGWTVIGPQVTLHCDWSSGDPASQPLLPKDQWD